MSFSYSTDFILDKPYFIECYEQTARTASGIRAYQKAIILMLFALVMWLVAPDMQVVSYFFFALTGIEICSVIFAKPWWLWRQMLSRAANNKASLLLDEQGLTSRSDFSNLTLLWQDLIEIEATSAGFIFHHQQGRHYVSQRHLTDEAVNFILQQQQSKVASPDQPSH